MTIIGLIVLVLFCGCVTSPWRSADCERHRMRGYDVLACNDDAVDHYCHKHGKTWDDGTPLDSRRIRACAHKTWHGRRPKIFMGKSYMGCVLHEIAHLENPGEAAMVEKKYPCIGEGARP